MMKKLKGIGILLIAHIVPWLLLMIADLLWESLDMSRVSGVLLYFMIYIFPVIYLSMYYVLESKIDSLCNISPKYWNEICAILMLVISVSLGMMGCKMALADRWIIEQKGLSYENMYNGIEYAYFMRNYIIAYIVLGLLYRPFMRAVSSDTDEKKKKLRRLSKAMSKMLVKKKWLVAGSMVTFTVIVLVISCVWTVFDSKAESIECENTISDIERYYNPALQYQQTEKIIEDEEKKTIIYKFVLKNNINHEVYVKQEIYNHGIFGKQVYISDDMAYSYYREKEDELNVLAKGILEFPEQDADNYNRGNIKGKKDVKLIANLNEPSMEEEYIQCLVDLREAVKADFNLYEDVKITIELRVGGVGRGYIRLLTVEDSEDTTMDDALFYKQVSEYMAEKVFIKDGY